jgi:hypothetical protein
MERTGPRCISCCHTGDFQSISRRSVLRGIIKPLSQRGTWLEGLCREQVPSAWSRTFEEQIAAAPFAE